MEEQKKLKDICDKIGYKNDKYEFAYGPFKNELVKKQGNLLILSDRDVREIIFTPDFIKKLEDYRTKSHGCENANKMIEALPWNAKNPVDYIYNTLELGENI